MYLLNTNSKRIHRADSADGRCGLSRMRPEYCISFPTLKEARDYPDPRHPVAKCCRFCLKEEEP